MGTLSLSGGSLALDGLWLTEARARDIEALVDLLLDGEDVLLVSSGYLMREGLPAIRRWMFVATTERLLCARG